MSWCTHGFYGWSHTPVDEVWKELAEEFEEDLQWLNITKDSIWNAARDREMGRPLTPAERKLIESSQSTESIAEARFWRLRPDGIPFRPPTKSKEGIFCILEFKRMSDCTDQAVSRSDQPVSGVAAGVGVTGRTNFG